MVAMRLTWRWEGLGLPFQGGWSDNSNSTQSYHPCFLVPTVVRFFKRPVTPSDVDVAEESTKLSAAVHVAA